MTGRDDISDKQIVSFIVQRDPEGYEALFDKYACKLYGIIRIIIPNDPKAVETVLSQTLVQVWNDIREQEADTLSLFTRMVNAAKCNAHRYKRSHEIKKNQQRNVFELMFCNGLSIEETKRLVDKPTENVMKDLRASFKLTNIRN